VTGPFDESVERTEDLGRAPRAVAAAVCEFGADPGFGERVDIAVYVARRVVPWGVVDVICNCGQIVGKAWAFQ